jgi:hypothetical protein
LTSNYNPEIIDLVSFSQTHHSLGLSGYCPPHVSSLGHISKLFSNSLRYRRTNDVGAIPRILLIVEADNPYARISVPVLGIPLDGDTILFSAGSLA